MELTELMLNVAAVLDELHIPYFITGSCASMAYGEPRLTNDIDVVADIQVKNIVPLLGHFPMPEFYISEDAVRDAIALQGQFNIIHPSSGLKVDIIVRKQSEYGASEFERRRSVQLTEGRRVDFASPENVILMKMEYYRMGGSEKHLRDITGILKVSADFIDREYISLWAGRLQLGDIWEAILKKVS
ncbi:MAG: hypothetical protein WC956_06185 [bacterium]